MIDLLILSQTMNKNARSPYKMQLSQITSRTQSTANSSHSIELESLLSPKNILQH